jgi:hypothetical protein
MPSLEQVGILFLYCLPTANRPFRSNLNRVFRTKRGERSEEWRNLRGNATPRFASDSLLVGGRSAPATGPFASRADTNTISGSRAACGGSAPTSRVEATHNFLRRLRYRTPIAVWQKPALARRYVPQPRCIVGRSSDYLPAIRAELRPLDGVFVLHGLAHGLARRRIP